MQYMADLAALHANQNFVEIRRILALDTRIRTEMVGYRLQVGAANIYVNDGHYQTFAAAHPGLKFTRRSVTINVRTDNNIDIVWLDDTPDPDVQKFIIPLPTLQAGLWIYDAQVQEIVDVVTNFVLRFKPDQPHMGAMIHECLSMLANRLELIEKNQSL